MKNTFLTILITALIVAPITFFATKTNCGNPVHKPSHGIRPDTFTVFNNLYARRQAQWDIDTFQAIVDSLMTGGKQTHLPPGAINGVVAYRISADDMINALDISCNADGTAKANIPFVRVYLGFNPQTRSFKLFVVPVNADSSTTTCGKDLFFDEMGNNPRGVQRAYLELQQPGEGDFVLDLISPCPFTCDTSSHLVYDLVQQDKSASGNKPFITCTCCPTGTGNTQQK